MQEMTMKLKREQIHVQATVSSLSRYNSFTTQKCVNLGLCLAAAILNIHSQHVLKPQCVEFNVITAYFESFICVSTFCRLSGSGLQCCLSPFVFVVYITVGLLSAVKT